MIPNIGRGGDMKGVMRYLVGPGKANEHERPHVVASDGYASLMHGTDVLDVADAAEIAEHLDGPRVLFGTSIRAEVTEQDPDTGEKKVLGYRDAHVWHCPLSIAAEEGRLSDEQWQSIATDFMDRMGFTGAESWEGAGEGKAPCRWVAVHHGLSKDGNDHIHIVASMVREDGTKWEGRMGDYGRAQDVCRELETKYGLAHPPNYQPEFPERLSVRGEKQAEQRQAEVAGLPATAPKVMAERLRAAAVASSSEAEWVRRARADGVILKPFYAKGSGAGSSAGTGSEAGPGTAVASVVTGYRAALKPESYNEKLVFYGGGRLGKDLSLPRLRERWDNPDAQENVEAVAEWNAAFEGRPPAGVGHESAGLERFRPDAQVRATQRLGELHEQLRKVPIGDQAAWSDAARDASGVLSAWARFDQANAPELRAAAQELSRSAQLARPSQPRGSRVKDGAMGAAMILAAAARPGTSEGKSKVVASALMRQVLKTAEALRDHHRAAGRLRNAQAVQIDVLDRLRRVSLADYQPDTAATSIRPENALTSPSRETGPAGTSRPYAPGQSPGTGRKQAGGPRRPGGRSGPGGPDQSDGLGR